MSQLLETNDLKLIEQYRREKEKKYLKLIEYLTFNEDTFNFNKYSCKSSKLTFALTIGRSLRYLEDFRTYAFIYQNDSPTTKRTHYIDFYDHLDDLFQDQDGNYNKNTLNLLVDKVFDTLIKKNPYLELGKVKSLNDVCSEQIDREEEKKFTQRRSHEGIFEVVRMQSFRFKKCQT